MKKEGESFRVFLREHLRPILSASRYKLKDQTAERREDSCTGALVFMRYTRGLSGQFDVRLSIRMDQFEDEVGAAASTDLAILCYGDIAAAPWRWPSDDWAATAASLIPAVARGIEWTDKLLNRDALAAFLEARPRSPARAAALSYCHELRGDWRKALNAWEEYVLPLHPPLDLEHPWTRRAVTRLRFLEERVGRITMQ